MLKRIFDFILAFCAASVLAVPFVIVLIAVRTTSKGPALYWSKRIGRGNRAFMMPKFRTMRVDTPQMATHLMTDPAKYLTPIGPFLRKTSIDEIPQLYSILKGDMSFVGPRPALFNQEDLIEMRTSSGVHQLVPGLTGWAQINGRDEIPNPEKVRLDSEYLQRRSLLFDVKIIWLTFWQVVSGKDVVH